MKIGMVTPYDLEIPSGVNASLISLSSWLIAQGQDVRIYGPASGSWTSKTLKENIQSNVEILITNFGRPHQLRWGGTRASINLSPLAGRRLARIIAEEHFDILHIHEPILAWPFIQFLKKSSNYLIGTFHSSEPAAKRSYRFTGLILKKWLRRFDELTAVSETAARTAESILPSNYKVIPNCIDTDYFSSRVKIPTLMKNGHQSILFVGRDEPRKGLNDLISAFELSRKKNNNLQLVIVGPDEKECRKLDADARIAGTQSIVVVGKTDKQSLAGYYRAADIFCSPATSGESFGLVLVEAMAAGTPVIATNIPGYRNVIQHELNGLLTPPGDPIALEASISRLIENDSLRSSLSDAGLTKAKMFSKESVGQQFLNMYDQHVTIYTHRHRGMSVPHQRKD